MKRTHVSFEEFMSGKVTERVLSLDDIEIGESFVAWLDAPVSPEHQWPVFERTKAGFLRREDGRISSHIREYYVIYRVKE